MSNFKVLFVSSGNNGKLGVLVENQAKSLEKLGVEIDHFLILGKGLGGYLRNIPKLNKYIKLKDIDIIHAHYSLSAFVATFASAPNLVVSLMGSDAFLNFWMKLAARFMYTFFWKVTIVKTEQMKKSLKLSKAIVIPNGVDLDNFKFIDSSEARKKLGFQANKKIVLFLSDPKRDEKNYPLANKAISLLNRNDVTLFPVYNVSNQEIPTYLNAADLLLLTSKWEGSVNVIKEAMACNIPIVSTNMEHHSSA